MSRHLLILVVVVILALIGCRPTAQPAVTPQDPPAASPLALPTTVEKATSEPTMTANASLTIIATIGPTCPGPVRPGQNCTKPYQGDFVILRSDGSEAAQVSTDAEGRAAISLPSGDYTVLAITDPGTKLPRAGSVEVNVLAGQAAEVTIELDTGMR